MSFAFIYLAPANKFICIRILDEGPKLGEKCWDVGVMFHICWNENETLRSINNKNQLDFFSLGLDKTRVTVKNSDATTQLPVGFQSTDWSVVGLRKFTHVYGHLCVGVSQ